MKQDNKRPLELQEMRLSPLAADHLFEIASHHNQTALESAEALIHAAYLRLLHVKRERAQKALRATLKRVNPDDDTPP